MSLAKKYIYFDYALSKISYSVSSFVANLIEKKSKITLLTQIRRRLVYEKLSTTCNLLIHVKNYFEEFP